MSRLARFVSPLALVAALAVPVLAVPVSSGASTPAATKLLTCSDTTVSRPSNFVISCADANAALSATHWTTWNATSAVGTTDFVLNLCKPYCAASKRTNFYNSSVRLSAPVTTKHGRLFSKLATRARPTVSASPGSASLASRDRRSESPASRASPPR